jgi:nitrate/nitrite-specific signal transduction histidine kinase
MKINLSLGQRLGLGFFMLVFLVLTTSVFGFVFSSLVNRTVDSVQLNFKQSENIIAVENAWASTSAGVDRMLKFRFVDGPVEQSINSGISRFEIQLSNLPATIDDDSQGAAAISELNRLGAELVQLVLDIKVVAEQDDWDTAQQMRDEQLAPKVRVFDEEMVEFASENQENVNQALVDVDGVQESFSVNVIVVAVLAVGIGTVVSYLAWRSISHPIQKLISQTHQLMRRDFSPIKAMNGTDEIAELSRAFSELNDLLRVSYQELEDRVIDRTKSLETSIEVTKVISTILDESQLVRAVVEQIQNAFDYYHAHIYLFDESNETLVLAGGTGQAGKEMLDKGHRISKAKGLVGRAAATNASVFISDVAKEEDWLPNPLLPETKAETAVPIAIGDQVLGVLDVQHNLLDVLNDGNVNLLQSVASQVAIALRNARLYKQAQQRATQEAIINQIGRQIQAATDVETVLQIAARELGQALSTQRTIVQIGSIPGENGRSVGNTHS